MLCLFRYHERDFKRLGLCAQEKWAFSSELPASEKVCFFFWFKNRQFADSTSFAQSTIGCAELLI